jgi:hypothetical protein
MKELSLETVLTVYENLVRLRVKTHQVEHSELHTFCTRVREFEKSLDETSGPDWSTFLRIIKRVRFELCAVPVSFKCPRFPEGRMEQLKNCLRLIRASYPRQAAIAEELIANIHSLESSNDNGMLGNVLALRDEIGSAHLGIVVPESSLIRMIAPVVLKDGVEVLHPAELRDERSFDRLVVTGSAQWFPSHVFFSPRAADIHVVTYSFLRQDSLSSSVLVHPFAQGHLEIGGTAAGPHAIKSTDALTFDEVLPKIDWDSLHKRFSPSQSEIDTLGSIPARLISLEQGFAVFVDDEEGASVLAIDVDNPKSPVQRILSEDIERGMFVLLRTAGGGDYVAEVADSILGANASAVRGQQDDWKALLRRRIAECGFDAVAAELRELGSSRANEPNLKYWASERSIKPHDPADFNAIMKLVGLEDKSEAYWKGAEIIDSAHRSAGFHIRKLLLKRVQRSDLSVLEKDGLMTFELPEIGCGNLTAFRVIDLAPNSVTVPANKVGKLLEMNAHGPDDSTAH